MCSLVSTIHWRHFSDIHLSQGSVATPLRRGGICKHEFVVDWLPSLSLKRFENRLIFGDVMYKSFVSWFFWLTVFILSRTARWCQYLINSAFLSFFWGCQKSALIGILKTPCSISLILGYDATASSNHHHHSRIVSVGRRVVARSSRVWTFVDGAKLAVQSQLRRATYTAPTAAAIMIILSSAGTGGSWAGAWMKRATGRRAICSRFQVLQSYAAKLRWPVDVRVQGTRRTWWARLATTVRRRRRHTEVGQVTWRCVMQTLPYQHRRLEDHSLTNSKPMKCLKDRRDVVMTTSAGDQTSCCITTGGNREGRRQRRQEVSCNYPAGNSQMPGPEHASLQASETDW